MCNMRAWRRSRRAPSFTPPRQRRGPPPLAKATGPARQHPARGDSLAAMLDEMAAGPGVERYLELNLRFHSELYALAGRPRLVEMIETLRDASSAYLHIYATADFPSDRLDAEH